MSSTKKAVIVTAGVAIFAPITRVCLQDPRLMGLDSDGFVHRYYEVKPIAGARLETISASAGRFAAAREPSETRSP